MRKGEIARYDQFLLFPRCSQTLALQTRKNNGLFGKQSTTGAPTSLTSLSSVRTEILQNVSFGTTTTQPTQVTPPAQVKRAPELRQQVVVFHPATH